MEAKLILSLFRTLGVPANLQGYPYLVHTVCLAADYHGKPFPKLKDLYAQTGAYFGVSAEIVGSNIRTVLNSYWSQNNSDTFSRITHYPVIDNLTAKEFIAEVVEYLMTQS